MNSLTLALIAIAAWISLVIVAVALCAAASRADAVKERTYRRHGGVYH